MQIYWKIMKIMLWEKMLNIKKRNSKKKMKEKNTYIIKKNMLMMEKIN